MRVIRAAAAEAFFHKTPQMNTAVMGGAIAHTRFWMP